MAGSSSSTRIGDAERAQAQRALQHHLGTGRLQLTEFVERFALAADAVTAADVAALFVDLPAPHPKLPRSPLERTRRSIVLVSAVVALAFTGLLGFAIGRDQAAPAPTPSASADLPPDSAGERLPDSAMVRRSTGPGLITLRPSFGVDLDDLTSVTWDVGAGCCGRDVGFGSDARQLSLDDGHVVVTGPLGFATCLHATGYTDVAIGRESLHPGDVMCVRTNAHRLALVTIVAVSEQAVAFGATVWDPPVPF